MSEDSDSPCVLLVEGNDDVSFIKHLRERHQPIPQFEILNKGSIDPLLDSISGELKVFGRHSVGILVDANDNPGARWQSITDRLKQVDLEPPIRPPVKPERAGTIIESSGITPRVGIWLMPDNTRTGELEDFIVEMIPAHDSIWPLANEYVDGIPEDQRKFKERKILKAKLYAWLATRKEPRQMGLAIRTRDLNTDQPLVDEFLKWLRKTFH